MSARPFSDNRTEHELFTTKSFDVSSIRNVSNLGGCTNPIRLHGELVELRSSTLEWTRHDEKNVYAACKNRRASVCEPCSKIYQNDAYQLIAAGLRGGKGVSVDVAKRAALFVTVTAPSFGAVHGTGPRCHPRRNAGNCEHGVALACWQRHDENDSAVGTPLCLDCFDYSSAVLWNASSTELWRRTRIAIERSLKAGGDRSSKGVQLQYAKSAEYQRRGLVHFHIVMRYDGGDDDAINLAAAVRHAVKATGFGLPDGTHIAWGTQIDVRHVAPDESDSEDSSLKRGQIAGYLAKYATKDTECFGTLNRRVALDEVEHLRVSEHVRRFVRTALVIAPLHRNSGPGESDLRLDAWAHQLGFRGHFLTKSRKWSTTFAALRQARADHQRQKCADSWAALSADTRRLIFARWEFVGRGYRTTAERLTAELHRQQPGLAA